MNVAAPISKKIRKVYILGASALLLFYTVVFNMALLFAEDSTNIERLKLIAPYHFNQYEQGQTGVIKVDPLITLYDNFDSLPASIKPRINKYWQGDSNYFFENETEVNLFAQEIQTPTQKKIVYAIEKIDAVEIDDLDIALIEGAIFFIGLLIFVIIATFIFKTIQEITQPFTSMAQALENDTTFDCIKPKVVGKSTLESNLTLDAINQYRARIHNSIIREQNFTRYISHELRTPMTVIQGCVSLLRKNEEPVVKKQCNRIAQALAEMEQLTKTFLLLARNENMEDSTVQINKYFLQEVLYPLQTTASGNKVNLQSQILKEFKLQAEPLLLSVLIQNIVTNSINCSEGGNVSLFISEDKLEVVDNGVGLNAKPRGYEGFGIGLQIVNDICTRYNWHFHIQNNSEQGCTATVVFCGV